MLVLANTTDLIQIITDAAITVDVHVSWADLNGTTVTPGRTNTAITTATTTTVVSAPAASTFRSVQTMTIRNKHASSSVDITVLYDQNATDFELHKTTLLAGEMLEFVEGVGFFKINSTLPINPVTVKHLGSDQSNSTTTLTEVTGLSVATGTGTYVFEYYLRMQSAATTTGHRFSVNYDGTVTSFMATIYWPTAADLAGTAANALDQDVVTANAGQFGHFSARVKSTTGWGTTLSVDSTNADILVRIYGLMVVTVAGNIELWHGSEVAAASTVKAGSSLILTKAA